MRHYLCGSHISIRPHLPMVSPHTFEPELSFDFTVVWTPRRNVQDVAHASNEHPFTPSRLRHPRTLLPAHPLYYPCYSLVARHALSSYSDTSAVPYTLAPSLFFAGSVSLSSTFPFELLSRSIAPLASPRTRWLSRCQGPKPPPQASY